MLGGFLRQMNDSIKQNREMVEKKRHKLFEKKPKHTLKINPTEDPTELSGDYLKKLRLKIQSEQRRYDHYRIIAIAVLLLITWLIFTW